MQLKLKKKGQWQLLLVPLFTTPLGVFVIFMFLAMVIGLYFALAKVISVMLIVGGIFLFYRKGISPWWAITMILFGVALFWNPFQWLWANMTTLQMFPGG